MHLIGLFIPDYAEKANLDGPDKGCLAMALPFPRDNG